MGSPVTIDGYLTQQKLKSALHELVGASAWRGEEVRVVDGRRLRWDMVFEDEKGRVAVEYDGDEHYRHSLKIKRDLEKDGFASAGGYRVVRIPYWVQLTTETLRHYFRLDATIQQTFPHGFITTELFPASFCELGLARFRDELERLPLSVRDAVVESLRLQATKHGAEYVLPASLRSLI